MHFAVNTLAVVLLAICVSASDKKTKNVPAPASDLATANSYGLGYSGAGYSGLYSAYPHYYAPATSYSIKYHGYPNYLNYYGLGYGGYGGLYNGYGYGSEYGAGYGTGYASGYGSGYGSVYGNGYKYGGYY